MSSRAVRRILQAILLACAALPVHPQGAALPPVDRVAFAPAPGARLPDARFTDEHGTPVRMRDYLAARPAIVVPAYYACPNLCGVVLQGLAASLAAAGLHAGRDADVVALSFAPDDTPVRALEKKHAVLGASAAGTEDGGWHFLTGEATAIAQVAAALGYRYTYVADEGQYAHAAGIAVVARDGHVVRVLYGVDFPAPLLRATLALAAVPHAYPNSACEASPTPDDACEALTDTSTPHAVRASPVHARDDEPTFARTWLLCFHYDPRTGRYSFAAMTAARLAALTALVALAGYVLGAIRREWRAARESPRRQS